MIFAAGSDRQLVHLIASHFLFLLSLTIARLNACHASASTSAAGRPQNPHPDTAATMPRSKLDPSLRRRVHSLIFLDPKPRLTAEQTTASAASEPPQRPASFYLDPNTTLPESYQPRSRWRVLLEKLRLGSKPDPEEKKLAPSALLTERNLTGLADPQYSPNVDVYQEMRVRRHQKKKSISEWIEKLP
jgi:hypothetical protein